MQSRVNKRTGVAIGKKDEGTGGTCPTFRRLLSSSQLLKIVPKCIKTRHSHTKNLKIFWGRGTAFSPYPFHVGRRHPSPYPTPQVPPTTTKSWLRHWTNEGLAVLSVHHTTDCRSAWNELLKTHSSIRSRQQKIDLSDMVVISVIITRNLRKAHETRESL